MTTVTNILKAYSNIAQDEANSLVDYWNIGTEVRYWVDCGHKLDDLTEQLKSADVDGFASRRGVSSANLSKMGKLVKVWESFDAMTAAITADEGTPMNFHGAYQLAKRLTAKPATAKDNGPKLSAQLRKGIAAGIITEAQALALAAL